MVSGSKHGDGEVGKGDGQSGRVKAKMVRESRNELSPHVWAACTDGSTARRPIHPTPCRRDVR